MIQLEELIWRREIIELNFSKKLSCSLHGGRYTQPIFVVWLEECSLIISSTAEWSGEIEGNILQLNTISPMLSEITQ